MDAVERRVYKTIIIIINIISRMPVLHENTTEEETAQTSAPVPATTIVPPPLGGASSSSSSAPPPDPLTLAVPTSSAATDAPVTALRRYLDSMPQHPSPRKEVREGRRERGREGYMERG